MDPSNRRLAKLYPPAVLDHVVSEVEQLAERLTALRSAITLAERQAGLEVGGPLSGFGYQAAVMLSGLIVAAEQLRAAHPARDVSGATVASGVARGLRGLDG
jgi:hypothetical protein